MKPFAVRFRDQPSKRPRLSMLRFTTASEAREYAGRLIEQGASSVAVVELDGRRYVSARSVVSPIPTAPAAAEAGDGKQGE